MKLLLPIIFLLSCTVLTAQNDERLEEARTFHEEGIALLEQEPSQVFSQIQALERFVQSRQSLISHQLESSDLYKENESQLQKLSDFFYQFQNSDSLLQLTRFYPDSVFQENATYSDPFKLLANNYLELKESFTKNEFFKLRNLINTQLTTSKTDQTYLINFDNYWPLEVMEFDQWLQEKENDIRSYPKKAREELLYLHLQNRTDTLTFQVNTANNERSQRLLRERIARANETVETSQEEYTRLRNIGLGILGVLLVVGFLFWKKNNQLLKSNNQLLLEEKKRSEDLLFNMLPTEVVRQLKNRGTVKARRHEAVSVLFTDFKNFSQIAKSLTPEELVGELDYCFSTFDHIIEKYRLQKIKTIGDAYMCIGGLYTRGGNHVHRMVAAALEIQQFLNNREKESTQDGGYFSEARIGIHTGPVVAGVIGTKKIAFDVWGDTVNVAQQMEQRSEKGKVNISGDTYELVKDKFECTHRGKVITKNKKEYDMYFVVGAIR